MSTTISTEHKVEKVLDLPYREIIRNTVLAVLDYEGCPYEVEINVTLTGNDAIQEINREHHQINAPTGVLSLPMVDCGLPPDFDHMEEAMEDYFNPEIRELMLGNIATSVDKVGEQTEKRGHSQARELALLTVHSMLHLFGCDHMEDGKRLMMEEKQKEILETRGYTR